MLASDDKTQTRKPVDLCPAAEVVRDGMDGFRGRLSLPSEDSNVSLLRVFGALLPSDLASSTWRIVSRSTGYWTDGASSYPVPSRSKCQQWNLAIRLCGQPNFLVEMVQREAGPCPSGLRSVDRVPRAGESKAEAWKRKGSRAGNSM